MPLHHSLLEIRRPGGGGATVDITTIKDRLKLSSVIEKDADLKPAGTDKKCLNDKLRAKSYRYWT